MKTIKKKIAAIFPSLAKKYKRWKKRSDLQRKKKLLGNKPEVGRERLVEQLKAAGIELGATLLVHSSLSAIGPISGGAQAVIDSLLEVIGSGGTLLMPASTIKTNMFEFLSTTTTVDLRTAASGLGVISESFRIRPGVSRSVHPTHSVCSIGKLTEELLLDSHKACTPCGQYTPYFRLSQMDHAFILHLGSSFLHTTSVHALEDMVTDFPVQVYLEKKYNVECIDLGGERHAMSMQVMDPAVSKRRYTNVNKLPLYIALRERNLIEDFQFGNGAGLLFSTKDLQATLENLLRLHITIYE